MASLSRVGVVGLGAIGGSFARALAARGVPVLAWARDASDVAAARAAGLDAHAWDARAPHESADLFVIAVPLDEIGAVAAQLRKKNPSAVLTHTGGLQRAEALELNAASAGLVFGTHPLAGSDRSGFVASSDSMFENRLILVDEGMPPAVRERVEELWGIAGARVVYLDPMQHDRTMAWMSHLPQLASVALAATLEASGLPSSRIGPGGRDATRLALSSLLVWRPLLDRAPADTITALEALESSVAALRQAMQEGDQEIIAEHWSRARRWRLGIEREWDASRG